jgi:hypothetical protein
VKNLYGTALSGPCVSQHRAHTEVSTERKGCRKSWQRSLPLHATSGHSNTCDRPPQDGRILSRGRSCEVRRLWALPQEILIKRLTVAGQSLLRDFWMLWRPLRLGWMVRRGLAIGPRIPTDDCFPGVTAIKTREGPREASDPLNLWMKPPEFYEDVLSQPNSAYLVFNTRKHSPTLYGVLITYGKRPWVRMLWAKTRDLNRWSRQWEPLFQEICTLGGEGLPAGAAVSK